VGRRLIDIWDVATYDDELSGFLRKHERLVRDHQESENHIFLEYDYLPRRDPLSLRPSNPHFEAHQQLLADVEVDLRHRTIRAFHYARLTDTEIAAIRRDGVQTSSADGLRRKLDTAVAAGLLAATEAEALYQASPIHTQAQARGGKFFVVTHPLAFDDGGVKELLRHWGGEVTYMWIQEPVLQAKLRTIGRPSMIEIAFPLATAGGVWKAATGIVRAYALSLGCICHKNAADLCATEPLPASAVLALHTEGEPAFAGMGRDYPAGYFDTDVDHWERLIRG
jgi:hypothetical protein